jgi:hypothetical protein
MNEIPLSKELSEMSDREFFVKSSNLTSAGNERDPEEMEFMSHKETSNKCKATKLIGQRIRNGGDRWIVFQ